MPKLSQAASKVMKYNNDNDNNNNNNDTKYLNVLNNKNINRCNNNINT